VEAANMVRVLVAILTACSTALAASILEAATAQPAALELLDAPGVEPSEEDVLLALERGWFDASKRVLSMMRQRGAPVASLSSVRASATKIRDQATEVINLMRVGANKEETIVTTAFQWAQRPEFVYLNIKFSSRIDGPVTCLNVDNERVEFGNVESVNASSGKLLFEGTGRQKPKTFRLNLTLHGAIVPENSSWTLGSVGRLLITIAKATPDVWPRLLQSKVKPKNMHVWHDRQQALDAEVKKEKDAAKKAREEAAKAAQPSTPPPSPPSTTPPPEGAAAAAADVEPTAPPLPPRPVDPDAAGPSPPPEKKKKKKGKKVEKKAGAKKDEL